MAGVYDEVLFAEVGSRLVPLKNATVRVRKSDGTDAALLSWPSGAAAIPNPTESTALGNLRFLTADETPEGVDLVYTPPGQSEKVVRVRPGADSVGLSLVQEILHSVKRYAKTSAQRTACGDGASKPLSGYYATLAAAQVDYPHASALTDQLDWAILQGACDAAISAGTPATTSRNAVQPVYVPDGTFIVNRPVAITSVAGFHLAGAGFRTIIKTLAGTTMASVLDLGGVAYSTFRDLHVEGPDGTGQVDAIIDWYWDTTKAARSSTGCVFHNIDVRGRFIHGWGISRLSDGARQVDNAAWFKCSVVGGGSADATLWQRGLNIGSGTSGNQTDYYFFGQGISNVKNGAYLNNVKNLTFVGGSWGGIGTAFYSANSFDWSAKGFNLEGVARLLDGPGSSSAPNTVTFEQVRMSSPTGTADGEIVRFYHPGTLSLRNIRISTPTTATALRMRFTPSAGAELSVLVDGLHMPDPVGTVFSASTISGPVRVVLRGWTQIDRTTQVTAAHVPGPLYITSAAENAIEIRRAGDATNRFRLTEDAIRFGAGTGGDDILINRSSGSLVTRASNGNHYVDIGAGTGFSWFFRTGPDTKARLYGTGVLELVNATTVPTANSTLGGFLYVEAGALKWRGSAGTVTTIAPA